MLQDKLYLVAYNNPFVTGFVNPLLNYVLYVFSADFSSWKALAVPSQWFGLTTYNSKLVLVGGNEVETNKVCNKLWVSATGVNWQPSLPPMPTCRCCCTAVNPKSPECIIVAGGTCAANEALSTVEVFLNREWFSVQSLPRPSDYLRYAVFHTNLCFMENNSVFCCNLKLLLDTCVKSKDVCAKSKDACVESKVKSEDATIGKFKLWKYLHPCPPHLHVALGCYQQWLIALNYSNGYELAAFSPLNRIWLPLVNLPVGLDSVMCREFPSGELRIIGECANDNCDEDKCLFCVKMFKSSFTGKWK